MINSQSGIILPEGIWGSRVYNRQQTSFHNDMQPLLQRTIDLIAIFMAWFALEKPAIA